MTIKQEARGSYCCSVLMLSLIFISMPLSCLLSAAEFHVDLEGLGSFTAPGTHRLVPLLSCNVAYWELLIFVCGEYALECIIAFDVFIADVFA